MGKIKNALLGSRESRIVYPVDKFPVELGVWQRLKTPLGVCKYRMRDGRSGFIITKVSGHKDLHDIGWWMGRMKGRTVFFNVPRKSDLQRFLGYMGTQKSIDSLAEAGRKKDARKELRKKLSDDCIGFGRLAQGICDLCGLPFTEKSDSTYALCPKCQAWMKSLPSEKRVKIWACFDKIRASKDAKELLGALQKKVLPARDAFLKRRKGSKVVKKESVRGMIDSLKF